MLRPPKPSQPVSVPGETSGPGSTGSLLEVVEVLVLDVVVVGEVEDDVVDVEEVVDAEEVFDVLAVVVGAEVDEVDFVAVVDVDVEVPVWLVTGTGAL
jgi:hypothetical protein